MKLFFTTLALLLCVNLSAQQKSSGGCATVTTQQEIDRIYDFVQHNPLAYAKTTAGAVDSIPLSIHIVGTDAGSGYYSLTALFNVICELNTRYAPVNFHFYIQWPIQYINRTDYYIHDFYDGYDMMSRYNLPNSVNVYFVQDPSGACGYYSPSIDGVAISKGCSNTQSTTLTHELGHFFSLPHTFYGWENGNVPFNPEYVRRSGTGANCNSAGDGFCDTYADYYSDRWSCPGPTNKRDAYGDPYHLDSSMYMSYSLDACQSQFSAQQMAAMQYNLHTRRSSFSSAIVPPARLMDSVRITYPASSMYANAKRAVWRRTAGADYYYVRLALQSAPGWFIESALTKDTFVNFTNTLVDEGEYILNVIPVNAHNVCMKQVSLRPFVYRQEAANLSVGQGGQISGAVRAYPNPMASGSDLQLSFDALPAGNYTLTLTSATGQIVTEQVVAHSGGNAHHTLKTQHCAAGIYFLRWKGAGAQQVARVLIGL